MVYNQTVFLAHHMKRMNKHRMAESNPRQWSNAHVRSTLPGHSFFLSCQKSIQVSSLVTICHYHIQVLSSFCPRVVLSARITYFFTSCRSLRFRHRLVSTTPVPAKTWVDGYTVDQYFFEKLTKNNIQQWIRMTKLIISGFSEE